MMPEFWTKLRYSQLRSILRRKTRRAAFSGLPGSSPPARPDYAARVANDFFSGSGSADGSTRPASISILTACPSISI